MSTQAKWAVQLHTVRAAAEEDMPGLLRTLAGMGWSGVQFAGLKGWPAEELAAVLKETGLGCAGLHAGYNVLLQDVEQLIREAQILGTQDIVCASMPKELRHPDGFRQVKRELERIAERLAAAGLRLSYHNHAFEFEHEVEGKPAFDFLLAPGSAPLLAEPDVYWVRKGGYDPLTVLQRYEGRTPLLHMKDMRADGSEDFAEIGQGCLDMAGIVRWGEANGVEWYVVEQDQCPGDPLDSLVLSLQGLKEIDAELA